MLVQNLRASTINQYEDCAFKYYLQYLIGFESLAGFKAEQGTMVHLVAELLAKAKKTGHSKIKDKYTDPDYLLSIVWNRSYNINVKQNNRFVNKYTKENYKLCRQYLEKILESQYNPLHLNIIDTEKQFEIEIKKPGFNYKDKNPIDGSIKEGNLCLRGTIDLIAEFDKETLHIIDWKTGERKCWKTGKKKEYTDFFDDTQFQVYDLAISNMYPQYKYLFITVIFVRDGGPFTITFDLRDKENALEKIRKIFQEIRSDNNPSRLKDDPLKKDQKWKCNYVCSFGQDVDEKSGKKLCDFYYEILKREGFNSGSQKLYQLSIDKMAGKASKRNDYGRDGIYKGVIK